MKIKLNKWLLALFAVLFFACCISFLLMTKSARAQSSAGEEAFCDENYSYYDIIEGATGFCCPNGEISTLALDNTGSCNEYSSSHGPGRETGGVNILNVGCRNYMRNGFNYGATDIAYWINMDSINDISNSAHRQQILSDIRNQTNMWNQACMYDGTGQIVNIYEVNTNSSKPSSINGNKVIEIMAYDLANDPNYSTAAGLFSHSERTVKLRYSNNVIGYNVDTVVHEFGHVLGLRDTDPANGVNYGTHKTLMGYSRGTTATTLSKAIKYQDVQGIAVTTGRHVCQDSHFMRYVKVGNQYRHICFYCDRIDCRTSIISGSQAIASNVNCEHDYKAMVSCGERYWIKCTKCYNVMETREYTVTLHQCNGTGWTDKISVAYGETMPTTYRAYAPSKYGYEFVGYFSGENGTGTQYYGMEIMTQPHLEWDYSYYEGMVPLKAWDKRSDGDLYAHWKQLECDYEYSNVVVDNGFLEPTRVHLVHGKEIKITAKTFDGYKFSYFQLDGKKYYESTITWENVQLKRDDSTGEINPKHGLFAVYEKSCVAEGTLITLADGSQTAVENLTGDEMLLVWNLYTGTYDTAPILFIDSDPLQLYNVINLSFSDGTTVKVISEHGFWDYDLNKYVYLDENAGNYIGHWFNKGDERVQLVGVEINEEYTTAWSPVTYGHLCYFVNGMLSMPGGIDGLFNIFDVDAETMKYDEASMQSDIETYGLFTYEEFCEYFYLPEEAFEAFNGQYMKVAIGKGLTSIERLSLLYEQYGNFLGN